MMMMMMNCSVINNFGDTVYSELLPRPRAQFARWCRLVKTLWMNFHCAQLCWSTT